MRRRQNADLGVALRKARKQQGLSQRRLALRAGISQSAISRIERGAEAPTLERFAELLLVLGHRPVIRVEPLPSPVSKSELMVVSQMTYAERLREATSWNRISTQLATAGEAARAEGHPATRLNHPAG